MNASNECPECPPARFPWGLVMALAAFVAVGVTWSPDDPTALPDTEAARTCAAVSRADPEAGTYYDDRRDVCHVWDGWSWRPVITK